MAEKEAPIHVDIGKVNAANDLPIAREEATHFPHVPGIGAKGALRVWAKEAEIGDSNRMFGTASGDDSSDDGGAGTVVFGEIRLALLPERTLQGTFKYVTCPKIVERLRRDFQRSDLLKKQATGLRQFLQTLPKPSAEQKGNWEQEAVMLNQPKVPEGPAHLSLEEREFHIVSDQDQQTREQSTFLLSVLDKLSPGVTSSGNEIVLIDNDDFAWFCQYELPLVKRNH